MRTSYWVTITTDANVPVADYATTAGALLKCFHDTFGAAATLRTLTGTQPGTLTACHTECHIAQVDALPASPIVARGLVDFTSDRKGDVKLDKNRLTTMVRNGLPFAVKVQKQIVKEKFEEEAA